MCRISFIVPAFNVEKYIKKCVEEILKIEHFEIEVIVVNDGSTDKTLTQLENIKDRRLKIISQCNQGVSVARNNGLKNALGDYIFFIDADDKLRSKQLEKYLFNINFDMDLYMFSYCVRKKRKIKKVALPLDEGIYSAKDAKQLSFYLYDVQFSKNYKSKYFGGKVYQYLFSRKFLIENDIYFPIGINFAEDCIFCFHVFQNVKCFQVNSECLYEYSVYDDSASHKYRSNLWEELTLAYNIANDISGDKLSNRNEIFFFYGNEVIRRAVMNFLSFKKRNVAISKIRQVLNDQEYQLALRDMKYDNWTIKERFMLILCRWSSII